MSTYAIGDLQGCYEDLRRLLDQLHFDPAHDQILLAGDLVNRGPQSLECLRFARELGPACVAVLGNHDLHLLAVAADRRRLKRGDTLAPLLDAAEAAELLDWLRRRPLAWACPGQNLLMVHAGLPPQWDREQTLALAGEVSLLLSHRSGDDFFEHMYGDQPDQWDPALSGWDRARFVVNCLTRLRFCNAQGRLALRHKLGPGSQPDGLMPWFAVPGRRSADTGVVFGHWSTLGRVHWPEHRVWGLDTGCIWGGQLTALDIGTGRLHDIASSQPRRDGLGAD